MGAPSLGSNGATGLGRFGVLSSPSAGGGSWSPSPNYWTDLKVPMINAPTGQTNGVFGDSVPNIPVGGIPSAEQALSNLQNMPQTLQAGMGSTGGKGGNTTGSVGGSKHPAIQGAKQHISNAKGSGGGGSVSLSSPSPASVVAMDRRGL